jgi:hypothetical protein
LVGVFLVISVVFGLMGPAMAGIPRESGMKVTWLHQDDFTYGTYLVDKPGIYKLAEDIVFDPNSPATLSAAVASGAIPQEVADALGLSMHTDAYHAGMPLPMQFLPGGTSNYHPGGPMTPQYDPAAFGVGFFSALCITASNVVVDLNGHSISQSPEHALLQRFFSVIELADQPFVPNQGPASFGTELKAAQHVMIKNGTIGLSSHHGIHGNAAKDVTVQNVKFVGYEVGAIALNGVNGLKVSNVTARNRKDIPVLGTFSSAMFIKAYIDELVRTGSTTTLTVDGTALTAADVQARLQQAIDAVYEDIVAHPNIVDGRAQINAATHPVEYALFNNPTGLLDGNSYSFLVNNLGVAVNGFPSIPDGVTKIPSENITFKNVKVIDQKAAINEIPALSNGSTAVIDPVGAVFQVFNHNFANGAPTTTTSLDPNTSRYLGNPVANAQALVAKAIKIGDFASSHLDVSRSNMTDDILNWVQGEPGYETLDQAGIGLYCNGDSMFHVNKGVIAFKMDAAKNVRMIDTQVTGIQNLGNEGSSLCGDYLTGFSHPLANIPGYGGSIVRAYTFSGSEDVAVVKASVQGMKAKEGSTIGFDVFMNSTNVRFYDAKVVNANAGFGGPMTPGSPTPAPQAIGFHVGPDAGAVTVTKSCASGLTGVTGSMWMSDESAGATVRGHC